MGSRAWRASRGARRGDEPRTRTAVAATVFGHVGDEVVVAVGAACRERDFVDGVVGDDLWTGARRGGWGRGLLFHATKGAPCGE